MFTRIQWRIAVSYIALIALVLLGLGIYLTRFLEAQQRNVLEAQLEAEARLVAVDAEHRLSSEGPSSLDPLAKQLGQAVRARITLIAVDGTVLGDSDHDPATMDNHAGRPEVQQALRMGSGESERRSATLEQNLLYVAVPIKRAGTTLGVARVALPLTAVQQASNQVIGAVVTALGVAALLAIVIAVVVARVTAGPIRALTRAAWRLAEGDLDQTLPIAGRDEVSLLAEAFNAMSGKLRTHIRAVEDEHTRLEAVLRHMANGVVMIDGDGVVREINRAAARLLHLTPAEARGRSVIAALRDHELAALADRVLRDDRPADQRGLVALGPPGERRIVQATASQLPALDESRPQVLLLLQDVTELRRVESVRREFVANVSHELRTPVASLKALVETLADGAMEDQAVARDFLDRMHVEIDGLAQLVEELLELSRIESGRLSLKLQPLNLPQVVDAAVERLRPLTKRRGLHLVVQQAGDLPLVEADPERIQQVVINLVHNAIKFTPPGGRITVRVEQRNDVAAVVVTDTGVGIDPDVLPRLFERFFKADKARGGGGTGLGLAITKHLVQAHGGEIWAESAGEGHGATFIFTLPLATRSSHA